MSAKIKFSTYFLITVIVTIIHTSLMSKFWIFVSNGFSEPGIFVYTSYSNEFSIMFALQLIGMGSLYYSTQEGYTKISWFTSFLKIFIWFSVTILVSIETLAFARLSLEYQFGSKLGISQESMIYQPVKYFFAPFGSIISIILFILGIRIIESWRVIQNTKSKRYQSYPLSKVFATYIDSLIRVLGIPFSVSYNSKQKESSIDQSLNKVDLAKRYIGESLLAIEQLKKEIESNKQEADNAVNQLKQLTNYKLDLERQISTIKIIANSDIDSFKKITGILTVSQLKNERRIGFFIGVISSLLASIIFWVLTPILEKYFF